jgi:hypothetical protein
MTYEPPTYTDEEIMADLEMKAAHWEREALHEPEEVAVHCRDYAAHLRTLAEMMRMDMLETRLNGVGDLKNER